MAFWNKFLLSALMLGNAHPGLLECCMRATSMSENSGTGAIGALELGGALSEKDMLMVDVDVVVVVDVDVLEIQQ
jgi:hypothetical protein